MGARAVTLENTLADFIAAHGVEYVVLAERQVIQGKQGGSWSVALGFGLDAVVQAECYRANIACRVTPESTVRRDMLGKAGRTEEMKALAVRWCRKQGIDVPTHDAAEAAVMWRWTRDELLRGANIPAFLA